MSIMILTFLVKCAIMVGQIASEIGVALGYFKVLILVN